MIAKRCLYVCKTFVTKGEEIPLKMSRGNRVMTSCNALVFAITFTENYQLLFVRVLVENGIYLSIELVGNLWNYFQGCRR